MKEAIKNLANELLNKPAATILSGSGISADSGVPTFRDPQEGLWAKYPPQEMASPDAFRRDPNFVWRWYQWRRNRIQSVEPNAGHTALVELGRKLPDLRLVTQNVDGLHQRGGHEDVIEFHGNIHRNSCFESRHPMTVEGDPDAPPVCPECGSLARPDVVWFGESIPEQALNRSLEAAQRGGVFIAVGTSATVYPAAGLADLARENGALIAEINPEATDMAVDIAIRASAAEALPELLAAVEDS